MIDKKISNFELATLNFFLTRAFLVGITFNALINFVRQDSWIIPLISIFPAIVIIFFIDYIAKYKPKLNLAEKIVYLFNKNIGIPILLILSIFIYFICLLNSINLNNFIQSQFLNKTPLLAISILFMLTIFYIVNKGINVITRTSNILFYISIVLLLLGFIGLFPEFELNNLKPMLVYSKNDYIDSLNCFYAFNTLPMFMISMIPKNCFKSPKIKKTLMISYIITSISIFFIVFQTIATFGYEIAKLYEYPEFFVLKHVALVSLSSRVESLLITGLLFDMFIYSIFSIYFIGNTIKTILNFERINIIHLVICLLIIIGNLFISKYNFFIEKYVVKYMSFFTSFFITTIIIIICAKIKIDKNNLSIKD